MTDRIRGRRLQRIRAQVLRDNPLCVMCKAKGRVTLATQVDHIKALVNGGTALVEAGRSLQVPDASLEGLLLDTQHGTEKVWLLWSAAPINDIERLRARLGQGIEVRDAADRQTLQQLLAAAAPVPAAQMTRDAATRLSTVKGRGPVLAALLSFEHH